jgi:hypothetical protein
MVGVAIFNPAKNCPKRDVRPLCYGVRMGSETSEKAAGATIFEWMEGMTLAQIEEGAIRASFARHEGRGYRARMMRELGIGKTTLLRKLDALRLRQRRVYVRGKG